MSVGAGLPVEFLARPRTVAHLVAELLARRGVRTIYGLCGGHIQPIWDEAARAGIRIVDVRHEAAAVHMAQAEADLSGNLGVAIVTAGPGLTNAVTGIANAYSSRSPVLVISGRPPRPQAGMGALQDIAQGEIVSPITRRVELVSEVRHVLPRLDATIAAALGVDGPPGPAYIDFPTDLLRELVPDAGVSERWFEPRTRPKLIPDPHAVEAANRVIKGARRPLVISGRAVRENSGALARFVESTGALYLDTAESRGALPLEHSAYVPAMRGRVMKEADLVITLGRRLDYQLGYGSPAVFSPQAKFIRIGRSADELSDNRPGDIEVQGSVGAVLEALVAASSAPSDLDQAWIGEIRAENEKRVAKLESTLATQPAGADGRMHPYTLLGAVNRFVDEESIVVADGGDILSFARVALRAPTYLDPGALGCLGIGVPFAVAAALTYPDRRVLAVIGDGSFGLHAAEIDTAVRTGAKAIFLIANNGAWNIERNDQLVNYDDHVVGADLPGCRYDLIAQGFGAYAERVEDPADLPSAIERALNRAPALIDIAITSDAQSPDFKSGLAGVPDRQALQTWDTAERQYEEMLSRARAGQSVSG